MFGSSDNPFAYNQNVGENTPKTGGFLIDALQVVVFALAISVVIYLFLAIPNQVDGSSMYPNLHDKEILLTNKLIQIAGGPGKIFSGYDYQRGDIVVFQQPERPDLVKRVIGLPGETVKISNNKVVVEGNVLIEDYIPQGTPTEPGTFLTDETEKTIPEGYYMVLGDNRTNSKDSRSAEVAFVSREHMKGAPFIRLLPFNQFGLLKRGEIQMVSEKSSL